MTQENVQAICDSALAKFGAENQTRKAVEELTELSLALQWALAGRADMDNIREEIADVEIVINQMRKLYDTERFTTVLTIDDWKADKLYRLEKFISAQ